MKKAKEMVLTAEQCEEIKDLLESLNKARGDKVEMEKYRQMIIDWCIPQIPVDQKSITIVVNGLKIKCVKPYETEEFSVELLRTKYPEIYKECRAFGHRNAILTIDEMTEIDGKKVKKKVSPKEAKEKIDTPLEKEPIKEPTPTEKEEVVNYSTDDLVRFADGTAILFDEFDAMSLEALDAFVKEHGEPITD